MNFSVSELLNFFQCERLFYFNRYGDKSLQSPPSDFLKRLWSLGKNYESSVINHFSFKKPKYKLGNHEAGLSATVDLMKKGEGIIYQGVLKNDELVGIPDFLVKCPGFSKFGDYYYFPVDVKGASTARERYIFQLACYAYLLGEIQGFTPFYGGLLLLDFNLQIKHFYSQVSDVVFAIENGNELLKNRDTVPPLFIDSNCQMCLWNTVCFPESQKNKDLSLVYGVNKKIKNKLLNIGLKDFNELANANIDDLVTFEDLSEEKKKELILQAKSLDEKKVYIKSLPNIKNNSNDIFFDFESDFIFDEKKAELSRIDYLCGFLIDNHKKAEYISILRESDEQFENALSDVLLKYSDSTFYHFGHYEQSLLNGKFKNLPRVNLINIEKIVKDSLILPVTNYSLKHIAKTLGFNWRNKDANAMQSMCWYSAYLESNNKHFLDLSIEYNHDDCLALQYVKNYLINLAMSNTNTESFYL